MNLYLKQSLRYICRFFCLFAAVVLLCSPVSADVRLDAGAAVASLRQNAATQKFPDDMKNLDLAFEIAERYSMTGDQRNADKFYLLTLQKSRVIEKMIGAAGALSATLPEVQATEVSPSSEPSGGNSAPEFESDRIVGSKGVYTVVKGDTIRLAAAKLGVTQQHLVTLNHLDTKAFLKIGQKLKYDNRKIVPRQVKDGIIINIPDRTLYYFQRGTLVTALPVALGSAIKNEKFVWQTPVGKFKITAKIKDPTWKVPPSIQSEMEEQGKDVIDSIPPGPENPLGKYAMKTSIPGIMIHSTIKPWSIYSFSSHGCIRVSPDQMEGFYPKVKVNTKGEIIYKPVKVAVTGSGRVYLEVHQDIYKKSASLVDEARQLIEQQKLADLVDWDKFKTVVRQKRGVAEDISL